MVALTVFLEAVGFLAVAALDVLVGLDLLAEGIGVSIHQRHDCAVPLILVDVEVVAAHAVAAIAGLVESEAVAVELQAFGFLAVALDLLARCVVAVAVGNIVDALFGRSSSFAFPIRPTLLVLRLFLRTFPLFLLEDFFLVFLMRVLTVVVLILILTLRLAGVELPVFSCRFEYDPIDDCVINPFLIYVSDELRLLFWQRGLHFSHLGEWAEKEVVWTCLNSWRESKRREMRENGGLALVWVTFYGIDGRKGQI